MNEDKYININRVAEVKGLKSNRSLRVAINQGKYIAREISVRGGKSFEILLSSLEPEVQKELTQCTALVPLNNPAQTFTAENAKLKALAKIDLLTALDNFVKKYPTKKKRLRIFYCCTTAGNI